MNTATRFASASCLKAGLPTNRLTRPMCARIGRRGGPDPRYRTGYAKRKGVARRQFDLSTPDGAPRRT